MELPIERRIAHLEDDVRRLLDMVLVIGKALDAALVEREAPPPAAPPAPPPPPVPQEVLERLAAIEAALGEDRAGPLVERLDAVRREVAQLAQRPVPTLPPPEAPAEVLVRLDALRAEVRDGLDRLVARVDGAPALPPAPEPPRELLERLDAVKADLQRGFDRVASAVGGTEQALTGELRALDARVGALADDARLVRLVRDGLDALVGAVDGVRQLASRGATSQQVLEMNGELKLLLAEIESARQQFRIEPAPLEATVQVQELGERIEQLVTTVEDRALASRLRHAGEVARRLGNNVLTELRTRRT